MKCLTFYPGWKSYPFNYTLNLTGSNTCITNLKHSTPDVICDSYLEFPKENKYQILNIIIAVGKIKFISVVDDTECLQISLKIIY